MRRSGLYSIGSSPVIIGALTVLITILAVFLAYNATAGLPFVPTYSLSALVPMPTPSSPTTRSGSAASGSAS